MFRIRLRRPTGGIRYTNVDVIKDAAANMLVSAGCPIERIVGGPGVHWSAGPVSPRRVSRLERTAREVFISTTDPVIASSMFRCAPEQMKKTQPATGEIIDMAGAEIIPDLDPVVPGTEFINAFALAPIAVSLPKDLRDSKRWYTDVRDFDISSRISSALSKRIGKSVDLKVEPDMDYIRGRRSTHSVDVDVKSIGGRRGYVIGMLFPFKIFGSPEDLKLSWYAGIGEKTRLGFGFYGTAA